MSTRSVYVIWTHPLFHESVRLLLKHPSIIWLGATKDRSTAREEIARLHPNTILFEKTGGGIPADLVEVLEAENWDMRIIGLSLDDNELSLYHRKQTMVVRPDDLLRFVLS
jgi:hypothetical protein